LRLRLIGPVALAKGLGGIEAPLALALERCDLVALALLLLGLQGVDEHAEPADTLLLACLHRGLHVLLHLFEDAHRLNRSSLGCGAIRLQPGRAEDERQRCLGPRPGVAHDLAATTANDEAQRDAEQDRVVELPDSREE